MKILKFMWGVFAYGLLGITSLYYAILFIEYGLSIIVKPPEPNCFISIWAFFTAAVYAFESAFPSISHENR